MKHKKLWIGICAITAVFIAGCVRSHYEDTDLSEKSGLAWWQDAKFGMFIHWGLYSIPAGFWNGKESKHRYSEHIMLSEKIPIAEYAKLAGQFNPEQFDADRWVRITKDAGMKFIVITAKHQDGFAMYDSAVSDFDVVDATPFGRDPMKELAQAAKKYGLKFGFYYSQARDHEHPLANWNTYGNTWDFPPASKDEFIQYLNEKAKPQVKELLTNYGDLAVMWFDVPYNIPPEQSREFVDMVHAAQPQCLVNSRVGGDVWDYRSLGDNEISDAVLNEPWETCMTTNDSWGFRRNDHNWKSAQQIVRYLSDIVSKGGNLLLNVGPTAAGEIPEPAVEQLQQVGQWLRINGESIYGAGPTTIGLPAWGRCTSGDHKLYLHIFEWPQNGVLDVEGVIGVVSTAYLLANQKKIAFTQDGTKVTLKVPAKPLDDKNTVIVLQTSDKDI